MQEDVVEPGSRCGWSPRQLRKVLLTLVSVQLALLLGVAFAGLSFLTLSLTDPEPRFTTRMTRYLQSGQLRADAHTLTAMCQYAVAVDFDVPPLPHFLDTTLLTNFANLGPVQNAAASSPKSSSPL